jgi:predicted trehalose synthase
LLPPDAAAARDRELRGARIWGAWLGREFARAYTVRLRELRPDLLPTNLADAELVLRSWLLEKALYEIRYELNSRPDWVEIPLRAALSILSRSGAADALTGAVAGAGASEVGASLTDVQGRKERGQ